jgi:SAM-dependent methyltransferase
MLAVLPSAQENARARATLKREGVSCLRYRYGSALVHRAARRLEPRSRRLERLQETRLQRPPRLGPLAQIARELPGMRLAVGDPVKSWDVLLSLRAVKRNVARTEPVLDVGACSSEIPCALRRLGYRALYGIDLDARVRDMPDSDMVTWVQGDMLCTPFRDGFFSAVTATSVIEHGFDPDRLAAEVARLLRSGGIFVASTDYWPDKIDTSNVKPLGMPWTIFSADELRAFIERAGKYGLVPDGELSFGADERVVHYADRDYTFAWLALRKC